MSDHIWAQEHVVAAVMGGLTAEEADRLAGHVRECPDCAAALAAARRTDHNLAALFAADRPGPELEDGAVEVLRAVRQRRKHAHIFRLPRLAIAAAVLLGLATIGAFVGAVVGNGGLPMPGVIWLPYSDVAAGSVKHAVVGADDSKSMSSALEAVAPVIAGRDERLVTQAPAKTPQAGEGAQTRYGWHYDQSGVTNYYATQPQAGIGGGISGGIGGGGGRGDAPQGTNVLTLNVPGDKPNGEWKPGGNVNSFTPEGFGRSLGRDQTLQNGNVGQVLTVPNVGSPSGGYAFHPGEHRPVLTQAADPKQADADKDRERNKDTKPAGRPGATPADPESAGKRVVIRTGEMEFEVDSFDAAVAAVTQVVANINGAFVGTVDSEKLANGKVKGSVTLRVPPERLDAVVAELRAKLGELKGMKINAQDVTKHYTDLESRLRAARTMEQRLLQIIKDGKGEIKHLLEAERELGVWRTKIEELEGEIRYIANQAALSTLTISLTEKHVREAAAVTENERVQAGVEVEDVDKAYQQGLAAVAAAKGRVTKSELKQLSEGQFNAVLQFEVPPDAGGPIRDRLRQLGRVARLEIDRVQHLTGGSAPTDAKVTRGDTAFFVQFYNLTAVAARETATVQVAAPDVRAAYQSLRETASKAAARVLAAQLNEQDAQNVTGILDVEVRRAEDVGFRAALDSAGEVVSRQVTRAPEGDQATDSKVHYRVTLIGVNHLSPRETTTLTLEVADVDQTTALFAAQVAEAKGRQLSAQSTRERSGQVTAKLNYEVPLAAAGLAERFKAAGAVRGYQSSRDPQAPAGKYATARLDVTLTSGEQIVAEGDGLWPQVRRGLSYSVAVLLTSVTWVIFGLCVVLPWGLVGYAGYRLFRRARLGPVTTTPTA